MYQALHIHRPALNGIILYDLIRPFTKLYRTFVFNFEADSNNNKAVGAVGTAEEARPVHDRERQTARQRLIFEKLFGLPPPCS